MLYLKNYNLDKDQLIPNLGMGQLSLVLAKNVNQSATLASLNQNLAMAKSCSHEGVVSRAKIAIVTSIPLPFQLWLV